MRYFIRLSYDGSAFSGWQVQENAQSIQAVLQNAFATLLKKTVNITGAGRTDAGVNASNYIAHFDIDETLDTSAILSNDKSIKNVDFLIYKINAILPKEIVVHSIFLVDENAHARFDAVSRRYKYYIHTCKDPFSDKFSLYYPYKNINIERMNEAAGYFLGEQDFSSLEKVNGGNKTSICNVTEAYWSECSKNHYVFTVSANRFLRNMVRAMVGSMFEVGNGRRDPEWIKEMLASKDRCKAGASVPGNALFLSEIRYDNIDII